MANGHGGPRPNSGRPKKEHSDEMKELISKHIDEPAVWKRLNEIALEGDIRAIQTILDKKYGKSTAYKVTQSDVTVNAVENMTPIFFKSTKQMELEAELKQLKEKYNEE